MQPQLVQGQRRDPVRGSRGDVIVTRGAADQFEPAFLFGDIGPHCGQLRHDVRPLLLDEGALAVLADAALGPELFDRRVGPVDTRLQLIHLVAQERGGLVERALGQLVLAVEIAVDQVGHEPVCELRLTRRGRHGHNIGQRHALDGNVLSQA